jgi:sucrose phosphorylase
VARFRQSGHRRDLNRPQFKAAALERRLQDPDSDATAVLKALRHALTVRAEMDALHPDSSLEVLSVDRVDRVVLRCSYQDHSLVAVHNFTASRLTFDPILLGGRDDVVWIDRLSDQRFAPRKRHALEPYAVLWLVES